MAPALYRLAVTEVNPAEREFEGLRRAVEGRTYPTIHANIAVVEYELRALAADPVRLAEALGA